MMAWNAVIQSIGSALSSFNVAVALRCRSASGMYLIYLLSPLLASLFVAMCNSYPFLLLYTGNVGPRFARCCSTQCRHAISFLFSSVHKNKQFKVSFPCFCEEYTRWWR